MPLDLERGRDLALALLPELLLTAWTMALLLDAAWRHREPAAQRRVGWLALGGLGVTAAAVVWLWTSRAEIQGLPTMIAVDAFRWAADLVILAGTALSVVLSVGYLDREGIAIPEYHVMMLFAAVGMMLLVGGADLFVLFLGLELMSVAVYVLSGINRKSRAAAEAALKYFLLGAFASAFLLYGIALVYGATGSTKLAFVGVQLSTGEGAPHPMLLAGLALLVIGFGFKVAAVPFHMWTPDVYDGAPSPVTAFMAAAVKAAAFGALARVLLEAFPTLHPTWDAVLSALAAVTMVVGNLVALAQRSVKRMLAYSSIAHAGYLLTALVSGSMAGAAALLFYLLFYTLMTLAAFAVLIAVGREGERDVTLDDLSGLGESRPGLALMMTVSMLALLGFPGTAGFIGKWYILVSATGAGYTWLAAVLVLTTVLSAGYYLPIIMAMYMKPRLHDRVHERVVLPAAARRVVAVATVALVLFGFWPNLVMDAARDASHSFRPAHVTGFAGSVAPR